MVHFCLTVTFSVDHLSFQKKDGNVASSGVIHEKDIREVYFNWKNKVNDYIPSGAINDVANIVSNQFMRIKNATYNTFIEALKYSLDKHIKNLDNYKINIRKIASGDIKLAFLIDIHTEFTNLYLNSKKGTQKNDSGYMPLFNDVIDLLESINTNKLDYIILCLNSSLHHNEVQVVALKTGNIRKQLEKQHKKAYVYAGDDYLLPAFQSMQTDLKVQ